MDNVSRRGFLKTAATAAAAAGAVAALPTAAGAVVDRAGASRASEHDRGVELPHDVDFDEPVVAHVRDLRKGEIVIFSGTREVVVTDKHLAARLLHASR